VSDEKDKTYVITGPATLSYPHIAEAQAPQKPGDKPKFSGSFVFAPGADLSPLQAAAFAAAEKKWPGKAADMFKNQILRSPFRRDAVARATRKQRARQRAQAAAAVRTVTLTIPQAR
jgi:hypothetical protein